MFLNIVNVPEHHVRKPDHSRLSNLACRGWTPTRRRCRRSTVPASSPSTQGSPPRRPPQTARPSRPRAPQPSRPRMNHYYEKYLLRWVKIHFFWEVDNKTAPKNTFAGAGHSPPAPTNTFSGADRGDFQGQAGGDQPLKIYLQGRVEGGPPLQMNFQPVKIISNLFLIYFAVCFKIWIFALYIYQARSILTHSDLTIK